jgi:hypothetical protein
MMISVPGENLGRILKSRSAEPVGVAINSQPLGRIVAGYKRKTAFYFVYAMGCM